VYLVASKTAKRYVVVLEQSNDPDVSGHFDGFQKKLDAVKSRREEQYMEPTQRQLDASV
jgi:hypothetical protein